MPTFGYTPNWGVPTAPTRPSGGQTASTRPSGGQTLIRSSTPERSTDFNWASAAPALINAAAVLPGLFSGQGVTTPAATRAISSALQAVASNQGQGTLGSFIPAMASLATGDTRGAIRSGTGAATAALAGAAGVPSWGIGPLATLSAGLVAGDDPDQVRDSVINSGAGSLFSAVGGPIGALSYQLLRTIGFNPAQGINKALDKKDYEAEGGNPGILGGFFGKVDDYNGYTPGQAYYPGTNELQQNLRLAALDDAVAAGAEFKDKSPAEQAAEARAEALRYYTPRLSSASISGIEPATDKPVDNYRPGESSPVLVTAAPVVATRDDYRPFSFSSYNDNYRPSSSSSSSSWSSTGGYSSDGSTSNGSGMSGGTGGAFAAGGSVKNAWGF